MADTIPNIPLPADTWVDLYLATGISVGAQIIATNNGSRRVQLATKASQPTSTDGWQALEVNQDRINDQGDSGAWARSVGGNGRVNVRVA